MHQEDPVNHLKLAEEAAVTPPHPKDSANTTNGSRSASPQTSSDHTAIGLDVLPESAIHNLREVAKGEISQMQNEIIAGALHGILDVMNNLTPETGHQVGVNLAREAITNGMAAAAHTEATRRVIEEVKKRRRPK